MESKMEEILKENQEFRRSLMLADRNDSQKIDLEWASVWKATCKEF